jgi:hypothetical protein
MHANRTLSKKHAAALAGLLSLAAIVTMPHPARAEGLFDFFFGGFQQHQTPPNATSYAEPSAVGRVAPPSMGTESVRQGGGDTGRSVAYCVRLCDGQHFPLDRAANATPVETCRAMCPASKTKVYFGGEIGGAMAKDGQHYSDLDTAFVYRKQLVANCTCNGKDAFGLAPFDARRDPTLRPGDIVSTKDGFVAYSGQRGQAATFTPLETAAVTTELMPASVRARLAQRAEPVVPAAADEDPGTVTPAASPLVDLRTQPAR